MVFLHISFQVPGYILPAKQLDHTTTSVHHHMRHLGRLHAPADTVAHILLLHGLQSPQESACDPLFFFLPSYKQESVHTWSRHPYLLFDSSDVYQRVLPSHWGESV